MRSRYARVSATLVSSPALSFPSSSVADVFSRSSCACAGGATAANAAIATAIAPTRTPRMPSPSCVVTSGVSGGDPHSGADGRDARAHDAPVGLHAAFLADADAAVEPARVARRARAQRLTAGSKKGGGDALSRRGP